MVFLKNSLLQMVKVLDMSKEIFEKRFTRLYDVLKSNEPILFVYTSETTLYNDYNSRFNDNNADIINIRNYLFETYPDINFDILAIHTNVEYHNSPNIYNYTVTVDEKYFDIHNSKTHDPYRTMCCNLVLDIFDKPLITRMKALHFD
jgi:hypothetical protein